MTYVTTCLEFSNSVLHFNYVLPETLLAVTSIINVQKITHYYDCDDGLQSRKIRQECISLLDSLRPLTPQLYDRKKVCDCTRNLAPSDLLCHAYSGAISFHVNGHFPCAPGLASLRMSRPTFWTLLELWRMVVVVTTGAVRRALNCYHQQTNTQLSTGQMTFLSPNQQCQH